jgi:hypothetical protein
MEYSTKTSGVSVGGQEEMSLTTHIEDVDLFNLEVEIKENPLDGVQNLRKLLRIKGMIRSQLTNILQYVDILKSKSKIEV